MPTDYRHLTRFLVDLGIEKVAHTQKNYLAHLVNVYQLMQSYDQPEELCQAGMFHSIYGTEKFQGFKLPLSSRQALTELIGPHAERLAYWNCLMDRASFDRHLDAAADTYTIANRETGEMMELNRREYDDLCAVHLFDWLEQVPRSRYGWDYRREAYRKMARRVGPRAVEAYDEAFSHEPRHSSPLAESSPLAPREVSEQP